MARITIEATDVDDLRQTMLGLLAMSGSDIDGAEDDAADSPPATGRGGRRKKTSPAATAALAATETVGVQSAGAELAMSASVDPASAASPGLTASSPDASPSAVTKEALAGIMTRAMEMTSPLISQKTLEDAGLPKRLSEIPAEKYGEAAEALNKLIASV